MTGEQTSIRMKSAASTHFVFGVFAWPLAAVWVYIALAKSGSAWQAVAFISAGACFWHLYFGYLQLTVSRGELTYRTLFSQRSISLASVLRSEFQRNSNRRDPRLFLAIIPTHGEAVRVPLKPFRLDDIRRLLAIPELRLNPSDDVA